VQEHTTTVAYVMSIYDSSFDTDSSKGVCVSSVPGSVVDFLMTVLVDVVVVVVVVVYVVTEV